MQKSIKISFIVAIYNVEKYVRECIESLVNQKSDEIEILLIDDGAKDRSGEICDDYKGDPRVKIIHQVNQGVSVARNNGLSEATGKWIYFVDGDDLVADDLVEKLNEYLDKDYDVIYTGHYERRNEKDKIVGPWVQGTKQLSSDDFKLFQRWMLNKYEFDDSFAVASPCVKLYRREFLLKNDLKFTPGVKIGQDKWLNMHVCDVAETGIYTSIPTYYYRMVETSRTKRYSENIENNYENLLYKLEKYIEQKGNAELIEAFRMRKITTFMYYIVLDFCHRDNPKSYRERREKFLYYLEQPLYVSMTKSSDYRMMSWKERLLLLGIRKKWFWLLELLNKVRDWLKV